MAWHHEDWLSFSQAVGSIAAVAGAFGVVFVQHYLERKKEHRASRAADSRLLLLTATLLNDACNAIKNIDESKSNTLQTETLAERIGYRIRLAEILEALNSIPLAKIPSVGSAQLLIAARGQVKNAARIAEVEPSIYGDHVIGRDSYGEPYRKIWDLLRVLAELLADDAKKFA